MTEAGLRAAFLRRKPIDDIESEGGGLERTLGLWQLTAIGIGGIIGAGIFSLVGVSLRGRRAGGKMAAGCPPTPLFAWDVSPRVSLAPGP